MSYELLQAWADTRDRWPDLPAGGSEVIYQLCRYADHDNAVCWPSNERLARKTGLAVRSVRHYLRLAEDLGIIRRFTDHRGRRCISLAPIIYSRTHVYVEDTRQDIAIERQDIAIERQQIAGGEATDCRGGGNIPPPEEVIKEVIKQDYLSNVRSAARDRTTVTEGPNTLHSSPLSCAAVTSRGKPCRKPPVAGLDKCKTHASAAELARLDPHAEAFHRWWQHYPRRVRKADAQRAYARLRSEGVGEGVLVVAAENYALECRQEGRESRYVLHPTTFLHADRWRDYLGVGNALAHRLFPRLPRHRVMEQLKAVVAGDGDDEVWEQLVSHHDQSRTSQSVPSSERRSAGLKGPAPAPDIAPSPGPAAATVHQPPPKAEREQALGYLTEMRALIGGLARAHSLDRLERTRDAPTADDEEVAEHLRRLSAIGGDKRYREFDQVRSEK